VERALVERALVERARLGDRAAFAQLATTISDRLYGLASRILRDREGAADVLQAALVEIWRDLPSLRDADRFEAWAHRVTVNCCRAHLRRTRGHPRALNLLPSDEIVDDAQIALSARDEIERAFARLTAEQRSVLVLAYVRDLSVDDIAVQLGVSPGTVKSRLFHARRAMRAAIEADARAATLEGRHA
jgi:RNA polymerase sigma-70 factor (ECF subfamily)